MKKLLLGAAFALTTGFASAQQIGIKGGLNYTTFKGDDAQDYDYRPGYTVGVTARTSVNSLIGIQSELLFTSKGAKIETINGSSSREEKTRLNYLDIPVLLSIHTQGLFFELGPQVSFLLKGTHTSEATNTSGGRTTTTTTETAITDNPYPIDFGYAAGLGYRTNSGLGLGLRYNGGFKDIDDEGSFEGRSRRNSSFQLTISYTTGF